jgi:hypothetical protein
MEGMTQATELIETTEAVPDAMPGGKERRVAPRYPCDGIADVIVLSGALHFAGHVQDLSVTGCRLMTEGKFNLERGTQVEVLLEVNKVQFRMIAGVRAKHAMGGVGLEFINTSARCARYLHDLVAELEDKCRESQKPCG